MSEDIKETDKPQLLVGLTLTPQLLAKIEERSTQTGVNRQEIIRSILIDKLIPGC